jgi:hypothetical protein
MARTLAALANEAIQVQDACNLSGVAHGFARAMSDLMDHTNGTEERNHHPIAILWADKIASLTGTQRSWDSMAIYSKVHDLASLA